MVASVHTVMASEMSMLEGAQIRRQYSAPLANHTWSLSWSISIVLKRMLGDKMEC